MRCHSSHTEMTTKKKTIKIVSAGEDVERLEPLYISDRNDGVLPPQETACASQNIYKEFHKTPNSTSRYIQRRI